uniref:CCHC-type domain-containing protein n=1 Tax=Solanum tuberosum TaxID=4113 RepID=M1DFT4_SOLTU
MGVCYGCGKGGYQLKDCPTCSAKGREGNQFPPSGSNSDAPKKSRFYALQSRCDQEGSQMLSPRLYVKAWLPQGPPRDLNKNQETALKEAKRSSHPRREDHEAWTDSHPIDGSRESNLSLLQGSPGPNVPAPFHGRAVRSVDQHTLRGKVS